MAVTDMNVCRMHGARSPQAIKGAERRKAERTATDAMAKFAEPVVGSNPIEVLQHRLDVQVGVVAWIETQLRATPAHLSGLVALVDEFTPGTQPDTAGDSAPALLVREEKISEHGREVTLRENPLLRLYGTERDRLTNLALALVKAGFEAKLINARIETTRLILAPLVELLRSVADDERLQSVAGIVKLVIAERIAEQRALA